MRVALITDGIWPYVLGGMQKHSYYLCKYLAQKKIYVDLYHYNNSTYDIQQLEVFTDKEKKYIQSIVVPMPRSLRFPGHYLYNSYRHSQQIYKVLKDRIGSYDFVYSKGFTGWYLLNEKLAGRINTPPIGVKFHGYEMFQKPPDFKTKMQHLLLLRKPVRNISLKADVVFSYGGKTTEIIKSLGVSPEHIAEIPSGVEQSTLATEIKPVNGKLRILYLGRYERRKGIEELNRAIKMLFADKKHRSVEFNFVGPIPKKKQLNNKQVHYFGEIRNKQKLQEIIRQNDILICPSWSEGMPNVILEAMANGLAVIATDVGATAVLVDEQNGWLLKNGDPQEIKDLLETVLNTGPEDINVRKKNALEKIQNKFTWENLIGSLVTMLEEKKK